MNNHASFASAHIFGNFQTGIKSLLNKTAGRNAVHPLAITGHDSRRKSSCDQINVTSFVFTFLNNFFNALVAHQNSPRLVSGNPSLTENRAGVMRSALTRGSGALLLDILGYPLSSPLRAAVMLPILLALPHIVKRLPEFVHRVWG